jgi:hypothetical protein
MNLNLPGRDRHRHQHDQGAERCIGRQPVQIEIALVPWRGKALRQNDLLALLGIHPRDQGELFMGDLPRIDDATERRFLQQALLGLSRAVMSSVARLARPRANR